MISKFLNLNLMHDPEITSNQVSPAAISRKTARSIGGKVFFWASALQMFGFGAGFVGLIDAVFQFNQADGEFPFSRLQLRSLMAERQTPMFLVSAFAAAGIYVLLAWLIGRWAGAAIVVKKRGFGWVGPLTMLLPAMVGNFVGLIFVALQEPSLMERFFRDPLEYFLLPWMVGTALVFLAGIVVGVFAGLVVRQLGQTRADLALVDGGHAQPILPWRRSEAVPRREARLLGLRVFAIGAGLQSLASYSLVMALLLLNDRHNSLHLPNLIPMTLADLTFVGLAALVGFWAGGEILWRKRNFALVSASLMALPALGAGIMYRAGSFALRAADRYYGHTDFLHDLLWPALDRSLMLYIPTILMSLFAALVLRHLGMPDKAPAVVASEAA
jgi:hypothetical protein